MVFPGARLFRVPIWFPWGGGDTREEGALSCRAWYDSALSSGYAPDSARAEGSSIVDEPGGSEPLCARTKGVNREVSEGIVDL